MGLIMHYDTEFYKSLGVFSTFTAEKLEELKKLTHFTEWHGCWRVVTREMMEDASANGVDISEWVMAEALRYI